MTRAQFLRLRHDYRSARRDDLVGPRIAITSRAHLPSMLDRFRRTHTAEELLVLSLTTPRADPLQPRWYGRQSKWGRSKDLALERALKQMEAFA